ncbi:uncharacterized protein [Blastocystis hominis]|uniref:Uncharacterized protein n=1 Tax=Blastocystis hominis TaxID=12968 RepID=D8M1F4_BLAHO|nr:uncharacterized protein [Blastocystis hominis]CBK21893.2 unnamed protein product [Blastocystis hominis]|eukprot:XP_012895941.1 uncharacterized protein [Blastocystis hominis]
MSSPISAVIWITEDLLPGLIKQIKQAKFPSRLVLHLVLAYGNDYPINYLRNLAIDAVATSHFFVADMDVWPVGISPFPLFSDFVGDVYNQAISILNMQPDPNYSGPINFNPAMVGSVANRNTTAIIVPVYEYMRACNKFATCPTMRENEIPATKKALRRCLETSTCRQFRQGQDLHNYYFDEWLDSNYTQPLTLVKCFVKDKQEPYVILKKTEGMPRFDERFVNYGYNKVEFLTELRYSGWRFYVLGTAFGIDVPHPRSKYQQKFVTCSRSFSMSW